MGTKPIDVRDDCVSLNVLNEELVKDGTVSLGGIEPKEIIKLAGEDGVLCRSEYVPAGRSENVKFTFSDVKMNLGLAAKELEVRGGYEGLQSQNSADVCNEMTKAFRKPWSQLLDCKDISGLYFCRGNDFKDLLSDVQIDSNNELKVVEMLTYLPSESRFEACMELVQKNKSFFETLIKHPSILKGDEWEYLIATVLLDADSRLKILVSQHLDILQDEDVKLAVLEAMIMDDDNTSVRIAAVRAAAFLKEESDKKHILDKGMNNEYVSVITAAIRAAYILGEESNKKDILDKGMNDKDIFIHIEAVWAAYILGEESNKKDILDKGMNDKDVRVRGAAINTIDILSEEDNKKDILDKGVNDDGCITMRAARMLSEESNKKDILDKGMRDGDHNVRVAAIKAAHILGEESNKKDILDKGMSDENSYVTEAAIKAAHILGEESNKKDILDKGMKKNEQFVCLLAIDAVDVLSKKDDIMDILLEGIRSDNPHVRATAIYAVVFYGREDGRKSILRMGERNESEYVREWVENTYKKIDAGSIH